QTTWTGRERNGANEISSNPNAQTTASTTPSRRLTAGVRSAAGMLSSGKSSCKGADFPDQGPALQQQTREVATDLISGANCVEPGGQARRIFAGVCRRERPIYP